MALMQPIPCKEDKDNDHLFGIVLNVMYTAFCVWGLSEILVCQWNSRYDGLDLGENNKNPHCQTIYLSCLGAVHTRMTIIRLAILTHS